ncbi:MAG: hypothetical protein U1F98_17330 [Verrucomicrobiota bacterium]
MKHFLPSPAWILALLLGICALGLAGCSTTESDNASSRPWNSPQGWENGALPASMTQPH